MATSANSAAEIRTVLLHDKEGPVQAIVDANALLDLKALRKVSGRPLAAIPQGQLATATRRYKLRQMEEAPCFFLMPTLLDATTASRNHLSYEIFDVDQPIVHSLSLADFKDALQKHGLRLQEGDIAVPESNLRSVVSPGDSDKREIRESLQNFSALRIRQRLEETLEIPPLPATADRIIRLRDNPNASTLELSRIVESDPSLAAQVVSWAGSPYYAAPGKIQSVQDAIVRVLGFDLVSNLAVGLILGRSIALPRERIDGVTPYWMQAVFCATAVEALFRLMPARKRPRQGLLYLAGLLHNFGYLVLAHTFPPHFTALCRYVEANPAISHVAIEHHLIGVSREQVSAWLMHCWNMPEELSTALRFQHDPSYDGDHAAYANLVFIALRLLRNQGIGDAPPAEVPAELYQRYGLNPYEAAQAINAVAQSSDIRHMAEQLNSVGAKI